MKAIVVTNGSLPIGNVRSLFDMTLPNPPLPAGRDLLVRVHAISVNPRDVKSRLAVPAAVGSPQVLGYDASGVVEAVGPGTKLFSPGQEVFYAGELGRQGSNAELQLVDERIVGRKPAGISHSAAASLPLTALTAYEMLFDRFDVPSRCSRGEEASILIVGGAGGVPTMTIQFAKALTSLTVIATASRTKSRSWVRKMGADHVIDHTCPMAPQIELLTKAPPVRYVFSTHTSAETWADIGQLIAPQGKIGLIDDPPPLDLRLMKMKSVSIHWEAVFTRSMFGTPDIERQHLILNEVSRLVENGQIHPGQTTAAGRINAANLRRAHAAIMDGETVGKIVLAGF